MDPCRKPANDQLEDSDNLSSVFPNPSYFYYISGRALDPESNRDRDRPEDAFDDN